MDRVEQYLDELAGRLRVGPAQARRLLAEAEEHLREATEAETATGLDQDDAQRRAIERFGSAREVAALSNGSLVWRFAGLAVGLARIGVVGSLAVLAGTLLARLAATATSTETVFGLPRGYLPGHAQVAHWLAVQPSAGDWHSAAAAENASDTLFLRGAAAVLCLTVSLVVLAVGRRSVRTPSPSLVAAVGATAFGGAGALLLGGALTNQYVGVEWGRGLLLCDATVALAVAAGYATVVLRRLQLE